LRRPAPGDVYRQFVRKILLQQQNQKFEAAMNNLAGLLEYVKALENQTNQARGQQVLSILKSFGITPSIQENRLLKIRNIVVDFAPQPGRKTLLFSAHYDAVKGSPGANDNASGVAVLLGLCRQLKDARIPFGVIFFDREEAWLRTPFIKLGIMGSLDYVCRNNLRGISALYNLEFCGQGNFLTAWSVKAKSEKLPAVKTVEKTAADLNLNFKSAYIPWILLSSDHLAFRFKGLANSITLTLLPASQIPVFESMLAGLSLRGVLMGKGPEFPDPLTFIHSQKDTAAQLSETSLQLALSVVLEIIKNAK
jgi:hypothetical protein